MIKIHKREVTENIKIKDLFDSIGIKNIEHAEFRPEFNLKVNTPYGYKNIKSLFRTGKENVVTSYFANGKTLKTSNMHRIKSNGDWKYIKDINNTDLIETELGLTTLKKKSKSVKKNILYDISVDDVNCYYSNGILSHNSWALSSVGLHALKMGKNVLHFSLELNENYTGMRYDSRLVGIPSQNLKYHVDEVKARVMAEIKGKLRIKYYPTKSVGVSAIKTHINRLMSFGFEPDLIIVDYADILRSDNAQAIKGGSYFEAGGIYEDLRGMAGEFQVPVWTASQAQRCIFIDEKVNEKYKGYIKISELQIGDFIETANGYSKVNHIFEEESQPCYKIRTKSGKEIIVSAKHLFPTDNGLKSIETGLKIKDNVFIKNQTGHKIGL
jgi:hypothetical protein